MADDITDAEHGPFLLSAEEIDVGALKAGQGKVRLRFAMFASEIVNLGVGDIDWSSMLVLPEGNANPYVEKIQRILEKRR